MAIPPINTICTVFQEKHSPLQPDRISFGDILNHVSKKTPDSSADSGRPPSKAQLSEILIHLRSQMNRHLVNAFSSTEREDSDFPYPRLSELMIPTRAESSKNYHSNQNNDVFKVREDLELIITEASEAYSVDPALVKSVIKVESNFNPNSTSPKGAMGLMQLMPETARDLGVRNAYDPVENVRAGTRYLKSLLNRYDGNIDLALAAYNWGMGNIEKRPDRMPAETKNYVETVTRCYERMKA